MKSHMTISFAVACAVSLIGCQAAPQHWQPTDGVLTRTQEPDERRSNDEFILDAHEVDFQPVNTDGATAIIIVIDTAGLWWWPEACGPTLGWDVCPDYISLFGIKRQVWGRDRVGLRYVTKFNDDDKLDHGELFLFEKVVDPERFNMARNALEEGQLSFQIHTHKDDRPYQVRVLYGLINGD